MINIIAAMTKTGVIGNGNKLPWNIPDELKHFRQMTLDTTVIMGMRTFESIGKPLPKRNNIILNPEPISIAGTDVCQSISQAVGIAKGYGKEIFVIGGAYTYAQFLPLADRLYISYIKHDYPGNVFFPTINLDTWKMTKHIRHEEFDFFMYER